jgi:hypothetical protein
VLYTANRDRLATAAVVGLGIVVAIVSVITLQSPGGSGKGTQPAATIDQSRTSASHAPAPHTSSAAGSATSTAPPPSSSSSPAASSVPDPKSFKLVVMNNTPTAGLAAGAEKRFEAGGWTVSHIDTMSNNIISTCAYYDPNVAGAKEAAEALQAQFTFVKRVAPRFAQLHAGPVVVVLTADYKPA